MSFSGQENKTEVKPVGKTVRVLKTVEGPLQGSKERIVLEREGEFSLQRIIERSKGRLELVCIKRIVLVRLGTSFPVQPVFHAKE